MVKKRYTYPNKSVTFDISYLNNKINTKGDAFTELYQQPLSLFLDIPTTWYLYKYVQLQSSFE